MSNVAYGDEGSGLITSFDQTTLDEIEGEIRRDLPKEKLKAQLRMEHNARVMRQVGSINIPTLGQKIATIPARTYFRALHDFGQGDASSDEWIMDLLKDNPALCAPGFTPKRAGDLRHGITFSGGIATGKPR